MTRSPSRAPAPTRTPNLALAAVLTLFAASPALNGCAGEGDIDRTQPNKIDKQWLFNADGTEKEFYFRPTIVGVPPTSGAAFEGLMGDMSKIRFVITEKRLIGYRSFDFVPGTQNEFTGGANNRDTVVISLPITSHFDVRREYNPGTGEQTNVISENSTDRHWSERRYLRVDWGAKPESADPTDSSLIGNHSIGDNEITNVDRPIFTESYIDVITKGATGLDYNACAAFNTFDDSTWDCGSSEIKIRYSFMAVPKSTYEPLEYPDRQVLLDDNGKPIRLLRGAFPCSKEVLARSAGRYSGADCGEAAVEQFSKFGFFRTVRQTYDSKVGATEDARKYYANRWNMWKDAFKRDAAGNAVLDPAGKPVKLTFGEREPREIVYYLNVEYPEDASLRQTAKDVIEDWNKAFKETAAALTLTERNPNGAVSEAEVKTKAATLKDIVVLRENSCNLTGVKAHLGQFADLDKAVENAVGVKGADLDKAHLLQACSVMQAVTQNLPDKDAKKFSWQRNGDLRYSFFYWVDRVQLAGPLGYGPSSPDPETGEIISAAAYNYGAALNTYAQQAAEAVELLNNSISVDDVLSGKNITDVLQDTAKARQAREAKTLTPEARDYATTMLRRGGTERLSPIAPGASAAKIESIKGTELEKLLMNTDILAATVPNYNPRTASSLTDKELEAASPANWITQKARDRRKAKRDKLAMNGCIYMAEFADDSILGTALDLKQQGLNREQIYDALRSAIFRGLADHEMGHTVGLRHNFAGSTDALNYKDEFWKVRTKPKADWAKNKLAEYQYSTVMDYGAKFNSDVHGLGKYDHAAIRFGYGQLIDIMPAAAVNADASGDNLRNMIFVNDYSKLPDAVGGIDNLSNGGVMRYGAISEALRQGYRDLPSTGGGFNTPERPYKFCSDEFNGNLDCKTWDEGANQSEIIQNTIDRFKNYYFFSAFKRGRLSWSLNAYMDRILERYFARFTEAFQFYYFFGDYLAGTDLGDDLLKASVDSINTLGEVLQTPEPGTHCATAMSPDVLVLPEASGPNSCINGMPSMMIEPPEGKPYYISFSDDYYYRINRAGSLYEKLAALIALTSTEARFFRVDTFADSNQYSINYYRLFKDEMLNLLGGVIRNDPTVYGGHQSGGHFTPTPVVDLDTFGKVKYDVPVYMQPGTKRVNTPVNRTIRYYALLLSLGQLNSTWDSTLDISNYMAVTQKGSNDDTTYAPGTVVREFAHPVSGVTYRAPQFDKARSGVGVQLIDELNMLVGAPGVVGSLPTKYGIYQEKPTTPDGVPKNKPLPNWHTAKANLDAATAGTDQDAYGLARAIYEAVDYQMSFRIDLLNDLRLFRRSFGY